MLGLPDFAKMSQAQLLAEQQRAQAEQQRLAAERAARIAAAPPPLSAGMFSPGIAAIQAWQAAQNPAPTPQPGGGGGGGGGGGTPALTPEQIAAIGASNAAKALAEAQLAQLNAAKEAKLNQDLSSVKGFFSQYGMDALWAGAESYVRNGYSDPTTIMQMLSQNKDYQQAYMSRFPAVAMIREENKRRIAAGMPPKAEPLPATYVQLEDGYRKALTGLPQGMYGTADDIAEWIVKDVSAVELADRVTTAKNYIYYQANDSIKQQLRSIYGMTDSEMAAYVLDPERALTDIQGNYNRRMAQATVGGAALDAGLTLSDATRDTISQNTAYGSSYANTLSQMQAVQADSDAYTRLGRLSGVTTNTDELVNEQFGLDGAAAITKKKKNLASQERARFGGASGVGKTSLSAGRLAQ